MQPTPILSLDDALGTKVEHWLNERKIVEYDTASDAFRALVRNSPISGKDSIGTQQSNFLLLQSVKGEVAFQSIRIRRLAKMEVDLLAGLGELDVTGPNGQWRFQDGVLSGNGSPQVSKSDWIWFSFDKEIKGDFDFEIDFKSNGLSLLQVELPLGNERNIAVSLSYGGSGLLFVDGVDIGLTPDASFPYQNKDAKMKAGEWQTLTGKVRHHGDDTHIAVALDEVPVASFFGSQSRISRAQGVRQDGVRVKLSGYRDALTRDLQIRRAVVARVWPAGTDLLP
jgi:hypothetical protein